MNTGLVQVRSLWDRIDAAERADDLQIWCEGLRVGRTYHIRKVFPTDSYPSILPTGDYKIIEIEHDRGIGHRTFFRVEGMEGWFPYWLDFYVFSYVDSEVRDERD